MILLSHAVEGWLVAQPAKAIASAQASAELRIFDFTRRAMYGLLTVQKRVHFFAAFGNQRRELTVNLRNPLSQIPALHVYRS